MNRNRSKAVFELDAKLVGALVLRDSFHVGRRLAIALVPMLVLAGCANTGANAGTAATSNHERIGERSSPVVPSSQTTTPARPGLSIGVRETLVSKVLHEERELLIYTPPFYASSERAFPVLYLLDGETHFHHVTGLVEFLANTGRILPMIVVGVVNTDRNRDFTPSYEADVPNSGGAKAFVKFMASELIPRIDQKYRTQPYRILVGHSYGGLVTMFTLVERPESFDAYVAISSSMDWDNDLIQRHATKRWQDGQALDKFLYFTLGDEPEGITRGNQAFVDFLETHAPKGLTWSFERMEADNHASTPHKTIYNGLDKLFSDWRLPKDMDDPSAIEAHYRAVSKRFHIPAMAPETALNELGYRLLAANRREQAIAIFRMAVTAYPTSPNVYDSLGEALETIGERKQALVNYELAVEHATRQQHPLLPVFTRNRDRLRK